MATGGSISTCAGGLRRRDPVVDLDHVIPRSPSNTVCPIHHRRTMSAPSDFPDLPSELGMDAATLARQQRRDAVRRRVRASVPPIPELRFEQAYLRSVMPALHARKGDLLLGAPGAIEAGREVDVNWRAAAWITLKDQVSNEGGRRRCCGGVCSVVSYA